ncbi:unnamed protein product [Pedinophyceae sp. YPF-701]|nr:unnamed protein product [Pedinophyceae sp. YPF-701]
MLVRTLSGTAMVVGFVVCIYAGHVALFAMIVGIQIAMAKELFLIARRSVGTEGDKSLSQGFFGNFQWWYFNAASFYMYGRFCKRNLMVEIRDYPFIVRYSALQKALRWLVRYHTFSSFSLYLFGFVAFVLSLQSGRVLERFGQLAWTHMVLLYTLVPSSFLVALIFNQGIIWLIFPCSLVIMNDIMAYFCGMLLGRTPLIPRLSPKKTWEGFVGGMFATMAFSFWLAAFLQQYQWMVCPRTDLSVYSWVECEIDPIYQREVVSGQDLLGMLPGSVLTEMDQFSSLVPRSIAQTFLTTEVRFSAFQAHGVVIALFASVIAPFGGFFASGFKRALGVKDFGESIPGHGGMTDRMDCQVVMAVFAYIYLHSFVLSHSDTVTEIRDSIAMLETEEKIAVFLDVARQVKDAGVDAAKLLTSSAEVGG